MLLKYRYCQEQKLLIDYLEGDINFNILSKFHLQEMDFVKDYNIKYILSNITNINFNFRVKEIPAYIKQLKKSSEKNKFVKWAIISNSTIPTALSYILKDIPYFTNKILICSTLEAATEYLGIEFSNEDFKSDDFIKFNPHK